MVEWDGRCWLGNVLTWQWWHQDFGVVELAPEICLVDSGSMFACSHAFAPSFYWSSCTLLLYNGRQLTIQVFPLCSSKLSPNIQINMGRTQHWNATHCELTPASEPDPETQFTTHLHPVLNGEL